MRKKPPETGPPDEEAPDERLVERVVRELRALVMQGQLELAAEAGERVIKSFYGSVAEARSRRPRKPASLARLVERAPEFGMTAAGVRKAVPLALQVRELGPQLSQRLSLSQHIELLPVREEGERKVLAKAAADAGWSVEELRRQRGRLQEPHEGGRPVAPRLRLAVDRAARVVVSPEGEELRRGLEEISGAEARRLIGSVQRMQAELERWEKLLLRRLRGGRATSE